MRCEQVRAPNARMGCGSRDNETCLAAGGEMVSRPG